MASLGNAPKDQRTTGTGLKQFVLAMTMIGLLGLPAVRAPVDAQTKPIINVASVVLAEPAIETPFPIQIGPAEAIPKQTFLRIRGLPSTATLSEGHAIAAGAWAIPLSGLPRLKIATPAGASGKADITISLVAIDGRILSEVKATLLITPASAITPAASQAAGGQAGANVAALSPAGDALGSVPARLPLQPPVPPPPDIPAEDREQALIYMDRGDESLANGNVTVARLFYEKAAELNWGPAALALAATYDPEELANLNVLGGVEPDPEEARKWYERARELGTAEAVERLQRLGAR